MNIMTPVLAGRAVCQRSLASPWPGALLLILYVSFPRKPPLTVVSPRGHGCRGRLTEPGQGGR